MGGKEKERRGGGRGKEKGGERKGERMWRGPESGLPRGPCWLSAGLQNGENQIEGRQDSILVLKP